MSAGRWLAAQQWAARPPHGQERGQWCPHPPPSPRTQELHQALVLALPQDVRLLDQRVGA